MPDADPLDGIAPGARAAWVLDDVIAHDDEYGTLANTTADDLRDALRLAANRLRDLDAGAVVPAARHEAALAEAREDGERLATYASHRLLADRTEALTDALAEFVALDDVTYGAGIAPRWTAAVARARELLENDG